MLDVQPVRQPGLNHIHTHLSGKCSATLDVCGTLLACMFVNLQGGGVPAGIAGLFGAANRALSLATSSFIGQVCVRLSYVRSCRLD